MGSGKNVSSRNNSKWEPIYYIALPHEWVTHFSSHFFPFFSAARKIFTENSPENVKITRKFTKMRRKTRKTSEFYTFSGALLPEMGKIIQQRGMGDEIQNYEEKNNISTNIEGRIHENHQPI